MTCRAIYARPTRNLSTSSGVISGAYCTVPCYVRYVNTRPLCVRASAPPSAGRLASYTMILHLAPLHFISTCLKSLRWHPLTWRATSDARPYVESVLQGEAIYLPCFHCPLKEYALLAGRGIHRPLSSST
jgi:hypothetical protein